MRICIDLDGVIANIRKENETYADPQPVPGAVEKLQALKQNGHYIIIFTARHMRTCEGNIGKVLAKQGQITLEWLAKHNIPYDEIHFGKPWADVYIDDNAFRFSSWEQIGNNAEGLPISHEQEISK